MPVSLPPEGKELYTALAVLHADLRLQIHSISLTEQYRTRDMITGCIIDLPSDFSPTIGGGNLFLTDSNGEITLTWDGEHSINNNSLTTHDWLYGRAGGSHTGFYPQLRSQGKIAGVR